MKSIKNYLTESKLTQEQLRAKYEMLTELIQNEDWKAVEKFDISGMTDLTELFNGVTGIKNLDLSGWDVSNVKYMGIMFAESDFDNKSLNGWNVSNVKEMAEMFANCKFTNGNLDLSKWKTSKLENTASMFAGTKGIKNLDLSSWNVSKIREAYEMFMNSDFNNDSLEAWKLNKNCEMPDMFAASALEESNRIPSWYLEQEQY